MLGWEMDLKTGFREKRSEAGAIIRPDGTGCSKARTCSAARGMSRGAKPDTPAVGAQNVRNPCSRMSDLAPAAPCRSLWPRNRSAALSRQAGSLWWGRYPPRGALRLSPRSNLFLVPSSLNLRGRTFTRSLRSGCCIFRARKRTPYKKITTDRRPQDARSSSQFTKRRMRTLLTIPSARNMNSTDDPP